MKCIDKFLQVHLVCNDSDRTVLESQLAINSIIKVSAPHPEQIKMGVGCTIDVFSFGMLFITESYTDIVDILSTKESVNA